jgi:predicted nucleotidyltransferase
LRFVFFPAIEQLISPFYKCRTQARVENNIDITEYPIDHYLQLLCKGNGNAVDNLFEPKIAEQKEHVKSLQEIVKDNIHQGFIAHCLGYSIHIKKDFDNPTRLEKYGVEKLLLCRYRVLLQGFNLLQGNIEHNLPRLLKIFDTVNCAEILESYMSDKPIEQELVKEAVTETNLLHEQLWEVLEKSELSKSEQSLLIVRLDSWVKKQYLGANAPQGSTFLGGVPK